MEHDTEDLKSQQKGHDERRILHYLIDERTINVESIFKALNLRESFIKLVIERLKEDIPVE